MRILSLDSGLRDCGVALYDESTLSECALVRSPVRKDRDAVAWNAMAETVVNWTLEQGDPPDVLVYEMMEAYESNSAAKNNQILQLAGVLGATCREFSLVGGTQFIGYLPKQWKGNIKKDPHHRRITGAYSKATGKFRPGILTEAELEIYAAARDGVPDGLRHNILDGIGIGLYHVRRGPIWR